MTGPGSKPPRDPAGGGDAGPSWRRAKEQEPIPSQPPQPPDPAPEEGGTLFQPPAREPAPARIRGSRFEPPGEGTMITGPAADETADLPAAEPGGAYPSIPGITITREIGRGGMGVVYEGNQGYLDRRVAVKLLAHGSESDDFTRRFQREAKILASLSHSNVVACYQAGVAPDGRCFLVMEFIDGPSLESWIQGHGPLSCEHAVRVCRDVASALAYAHRSGIIHRDVKPANVLLKTIADAKPGEVFPYQPMLADLGLARVSQASEVNLTMQGLTVQGTVMGSPPTMAPEQFDAPDDVDFRTDIYGLGCVLFHCLTGKLAFEQTSLTSLIARKTQEEPPDPRALRRDVPSALAEVVRAMLARQPADRPASYDELLRRLEGPFDFAGAKRSRAPRVALAAVALLGGGWLLTRLLAGGVAPEPPLVPDPVPEPQPEPEPDPGPPEPDPGPGPDPDPGPVIVVVPDPPVLPEPDPPPPDPEPTPEPGPKLPELPLIKVGEKWTLLGGAFQRSPLEDWEMTEGKNDEWSVGDDGGAQALFLTGRSAAEHVLPAPPWKLAGKMELLSKRASSGRLSVVLMLADDQGLEFQQRIEGDEVRVGAFLTQKGVDGAWVARDELAELSFGAMGRKDYEACSPFTLRASFDGELLVLEWIPSGPSEDSAPRQLELSRERLEGLGLPRGIGLELEAGSAILRDFVVEGE